VDLKASTLGDWVTAGTDALDPIARAIWRNALGAHLLQSDDTGIKVLDKDHPNGVKRGHLWVYLGDGRWSAFVYTPDWKGEWPQSFLAERKGWLQVDGYAGYDDLFTREGATAIEVSCWAHARRGFVETLEAGDLRAAIPVELIRQRRRQLSVTRHRESLTLRTRSNQAPVALHRRRRPHPHKQNRNLRMSPFLETDRIEVLRCATSVSAVRSPVVGRILRPPVRIGIRQYAKQYYRATLLGGNVVHPVLGSIGFTWRGWRHLTSQRRAQQSIHDSLRLLPIVPEILKSGATYAGLRRTARIMRGEWITESRLIALDHRPVDVDGLGERKIRIVVRNNIAYPADWFSDPRMEERSFWAIRPRPEVTLAEGDLS
jgi:hypothetical protein